MNFREFFPFNPSRQGDEKTEELENEDLEKYVVIGREALLEERKVEERKHGAKDPHLLEIDLGGLTLEDFRIYGKFKTGELEKDEFENYREHLRRKYQEHAKEQEDRGVYSDSSDKFPQMHLTAMILNQMMVNEAMRRRQIKSSGSSQ